MQDWKSEILYELPDKMNVKPGLIVVLLLWGQFALANMSSPIWKGTKTSSAISSKDIDILSEKIFIKIDPMFQTARFIVEYTIQSDLSGRQIPLLFCAQDYKDSFIVWLGNTKLTAQHVPVKYSGYSSFKAFEGALNKDEIVIYWEENTGSIYKLSDLKYFEANIEKGIHTVRVEYTANVWTDNSGWIKEFSFRYSLTPAKYWKSFGSLEVVVEQKDSIRKLATNLGLPNEQQIRQMNTWIFSALPDEYIKISFIPELSGLAKLLIVIEPFGFAVIATIVFAMIHFFLTIRYRRNNVQKKYSFIVLSGSICIPFLILLTYIYSFGLIDHVIGENAGRYHGYVFLFFILYPFILGFYWVIFWQIDRQYKKKLIKSDKNIHNRQAVSESLYPPYK